MPEARSPDEALAHRVVDGAYAALLAKGDKSKAKQELQSALEKNLSQGDRQAVTELLKKI